MTRRIALWSLAGFIVAGGWVAFVGAFAPLDRIEIMRSHVLVAIIEITAPAALLRYFMPTKYYWFILMNAVAYSVVGLGVELLRHSPRHAPAR